MQGGAGGEQNKIKNKQSQCDGHPGPPIFQRGKMRLSLFRACYPFLFGPVSPAGVTSLLLLLIPLGYLSLQHLRRLFPSIRTFLSFHCLRLSWMIGQFLVFQSWLPGISWDSCKMSASKTATQLNWNLWGQAGLPLKNK